SQRFRLFPIVIVTAFAVLGLKITDLIRKDAITFASIGVALAQEKPADKKAAKEAAPKSKKAEEGAKESAKAEMKKDKKMAKKDKDKSKMAPKEQALTSLSQSEVALLGALSERRKELDKRQKEIVLRENLLKAVEKRIDDKIKKLEEIRDEIKVRTVQEKKLQNDKFKKLVAIYEGMKPKEAARIFSSLNSKVVLQVAERIAPRKMSAILAKMDAKAAERLTVQLADKASGDSGISGELPQIGNGKSG
ncbi:MAG: hypothetical protein VST69_01980, partial [Nitrospirota bacterium]|nr:hypothetical protein [Nitrospirota bacterium]